MIEKQIKIGFTSTINQVMTEVSGKVWKDWSVSIRPVERDAKNALPIYINHVEYILHESFETPRICCKAAPYVLDSEGWGEFDLGIIFHFKDEFIPPQSIMFGLNFKKARYSQLKSLTLDVEYLLKQQQIFMTNKNKKNTRRKRSVVVSPSIKECGEEQTHSSVGSKVITRERGLSSSSSNSIMTPASSSSSITVLATPPQSLLITSDESDLLPSYHISSSKNNDHHHHQQQQQQQKKQFYYEDYCRSLSHKNFQQIMHNNDFYNNNNAATHSSFSINGQQHTITMDRSISVNSNSSSSSNNNNNSSENISSHYNHSLNASRHISTTDEQQEGIPKEIDMLILGKSLESLNDDNLRKAYDIIFIHPEQRQNIGDTGEINKMHMIETEDHVFFDLYSLDNWKLRKLWTLTRYI